MISPSERRNLETAIQCLELAVHPNTGDGEAGGSINAWRRKVNGMPLEEVCRQLFDKQYALGTTLLEYEVEWKEHFEAKQQRIHELLGETINLRRELAEAKKALEQVTKQHQTLSGLFMKKKPKPTIQMKPKPPEPEPPKPEPPKPEVKVEPPRPVAPEPTKAPSSKVEWSDADTDYLISIHMEDQKRSNRTLAAMCTQQFDRELTINAIRGALNRLREAKRIPRYRPGHERTKKDAA